MGEWEWSSNAFVNASFATKSAKESSSQSLGEAGSLCTDVGAEEVVGTTREAELTTREVELKLGPLIAGEAV